MKLVGVLVAAVLLAACGSGAPTAQDATEAAQAEKAFSLDRCELGGDTYTSVTIYLTVAPEREYEAEAEVTLHPKGAKGDAEKYPVSFFVRRNATRVYVQPGMDVGSHNYKTCEVRLRNVDSV